MAHVIVWYVVVVARSLSVDNIFFKKKKKRFFFRTYVTVCVSNLFYRGSPLLPLLGLSWWWCRCRCQACGGWTWRSRLFIWRVLKDKLHNILSMVVKFKLWLLHRQHPTRANDNTQSCCTSSLAASFSQEPQSANRGQYLWMWWLSRIARDNRDLFASDYPFRGHSAGGGRSGILPQLTSQPWPRPQFLPPKAIIYQYDSEVPFWMTPNLKYVFLFFILFITLFKTIYS